MGDDVECRAISKMFNNRTDSLLIGSLKSNMGHTEVTAGLCSLVKAILIFETGTIPANLHFDPLDRNLSGIGNGKLKVRLNCCINMIFVFLFEVVNLYLSKKY